MNRKRPSGLVLQRVTRRSAVVCWAALALLVSGLPTAAFAIGPIDPPPDPPDEPPPVVFVPAADGFVWTVPDRFKVKADGRYEWNYDEATSTYLPSHVRPASWPVNVRGCRTEEDSDSPTATVNTYTFLRADRGPVVSGKRCNVQLSFPREGSYQVRMVVAAPDGSKIGTWTNTVVVKDLLIVTIGDSYAAGEGNPEYSRLQGQKYGHWVDDRCHRSSYAGPARAAYALERQDPKTSVTFLSFACSGANINLDANADGEDWDPYKPKTSNKVGSGVLGPFMGAQPSEPVDFTDRLPSQIDQLRTTLGVGSVPASELRDIDALWMSAGGNDAGFGLLASACVVSDYCLEDTFTSTDGTTKVPLPVRVDQDLDLMPARYKALADALKPENLGIKIAKSYITEYPDPGTEVRSDSGQVEECEEILEDVMWLVRAEVEGRQWIRGWENPRAAELGTELGFARKVFLPRLNAAIASAAQSYNWSYVGGISDGFQGHGYCVGPNDSPDPERYVVTAAIAVELQGPCTGNCHRELTKGTLHPNQRGHLVYRDRILAAAQAQLVGAAPDGNVSYAFDLTPPTGSAVVAPAANGAGWHSGPATVTVTGRPGGTNIFSHIELQVDGGPWQSTTGPVASVPVTGEGVHTVTYRAVDWLDQASAPQSTVVRIDTTDPVVTVTAPIAAQDYLLNEAVAVSYACYDVGGSGVASCTAPVPDAGQLDTSTAGTKTFAVTGTDSAGRTTTVTVPYRVAYPFGGFLSPANSVPVKALKAGRVLPISFSLGGDRGLEILAENSPRSRAIDCDSRAPLDAVEVTANTAGKSGLSYDDGAYVYKWATDPTWAGSCRRLDVELDDGVVHSLFLTFEGKS